MSADAVKDVNWVECSARYHGTNIGTEQWYCERPDGHPGFHAAFEDTTYEMYWMNPEDRVSNRVRNEDIAAAARLGVVIDTRGKP